MGPPLTLMGTVLFNVVVVVEEIVVVEVLEVAVTANVPVTVLDVEDDELLPEQLTAMLVIPFAMVPLPFVTVQVCPTGWVATVMAY